ncbi:MAG TPA: hypothetical protein VND64_26805, partial [Pirellulales bacterium]|nr:hypothetical protein [Pirellulales bacterium]
MGKRNAAASSGRPPRIHAPARKSGAKRLTAASGAKPPQRTHSRCLLGFLRIYNASLGAQEDNLIEAEVGVSLRQMQEQLDLGETEIRLLAGSGLIKTRIGDDAGRREEGRRSAAPENGSSPDPRRGRRDERPSRKNYGPALAPRTRFVLTDDGVTIARHICESFSLLTLRPFVAVPAPETVTNAGAAVENPTWDPASGCFSLGARILKVLGDDATRQRALLDACRARNFENPIDSPWPDMPPLRRVRYLGKKLETLNAHQTGDRRVHFACRDKGLRFCWW